MTHTISTLEDQRGDMLICLFRWAETRHLAVTMAPLGGWSEVEKDSNAAFFKASWAMILGVLSSSCCLGVICNKTWLDSIECWVLKGASQQINVSDVKYRWVDSGDPKRLAGLCPSDRCVTQRGAVSTPRHRPNNGHQHRWVPLLPHSNFFHRPLHHFSPAVSLQWVSATSWAEIGWYWMLEHAGKLHEILHMLCSLYSTFLPSGA